jgi:hypothetical protein
MTKLCAFSIAALLSLTCAAQSQSIKSVSSNERGTFTTEVKRTGDVVTATTRFVPNKGPSYQPMGTSGYKPTGGDGYKPMGR